MAKKLKKTATPKKKAPRARKTTNLRTASATRAGVTVTPVTPTRLGGIETALTKQQIIAELTRSPHGDLQQYVAIGARAAKEDPDFFGHLVAYNHRTGQIRDAKVALPVIALANTSDPVYQENAAAHLADLSPREFLRACNFLRELKGPSRVTRRLVKRYLLDYELGEFGEFERAATIHHDPLQELYTRFAIPSKRNTFVKAAIVEQHPTAGTLAIIKKLADMTPEAAAAAILNNNIPFHIAEGALQGKINDPKVLLALIEKMTPLQGVNNTKKLKAWGVEKHPAAMAAFEALLKRAADSKQSTLKTTQAAEALGDTVLGNKLRAVQEKQLDKLATVEGNWLILADKSGSMHTAIEAARQIAAVLARVVKGEVHLIFFDTSPRYFNATGKTLDEITKLTKGISSGGGTSIGCGVQYAIDNKLPVDGIAIVSDGADHGGTKFGTVYQRYCERLGVEPTVYLYDLPGEPNSLTAECRSKEIDVQCFDFRGKQIDYYSLPNTVQTMRVGRYSQLDEVLNVSLKSLDQVLTNTKGHKVVVNAANQHVEAV